MTKKSWIFFAVLFLAQGAIAAPSKHLKRFVLEIPRLVDHREVQPEKLTRFLKWRHKLLNVQLTTDSYLEYTKILKELGQIDWLKEAHQYQEQKPWTGKQWFDYLFLMARTSAWVETAIDREQRKFQEKLNLTKNLSNRIKDDWKPSFMKTYRLLKGLHLSEYLKDGLLWLEESGFTALRSRRVNSSRMHAEIFRFRRDALIYLSRSLAFPSRIANYDGKSMQEWIDFLLRIKRNFKNSKKTQTGERANSFSQYLKESISSGIAFPAYQEQLMDLFVFYRARNTAVYQLIQTKNLSKREKKLGLLYLRTINSWMNQEWRNLYAWYFITNPKLASQIVAKDFLARKPTRTEFERFEDQLYAKNELGLKKLTADARRVMGRTDYQGLYPVLESLLLQIKEITRIRRLLEIEIKELEYKGPLGKTPRQNRVIQSKLLSG